MIEIASKIPRGSILKTPSGRAEFEIYHIDGERIMIRVPVTNTIIKIPAACFEESSIFLRGKGWIRIGAVHGAACRGSFDEFVQRFTSETSAASYVAPILEKAGIVKIDRKRPARIKLR